MLIKNAFSFMYRAFAKNLHRNSIKLKDRKFKVCSLLSFVSDNFAQSYTLSKTVLSRTFDKAEDKVEYRVDKKEVDNTDED